MVNGDPWDIMARLNDEVKELRNEVTKMYDEIRELRNENVKLQKKVASLEAKIDTTLKNYNFTMFFIKWVVTPLIVILGALAGVKMVIPNP